jgi:hypothetical protein
MGLREAFAEYKREIATFGASLAILAGATFLATRPSKLETIAQPATEVKGYYPPDTAAWPKLIIQALQSQATPLEHNRQRETTPNHWNYDAMPKMRPMEDTPYVPTPSGDYSDYYQSRGYELVPAEEKRK